MTGSAVDVVPVAYRAADGKMKDLKPLMSEPVVIPKMSRDLADHSLALCAALSKAHGAKVEFNLQASVQPRMEFGATGESGRDAASALLNQALQNFAVRAIYEPGDKTYYVSFVPAFQALPKVATPTPTSQL